MAKQQFDGLNYRKAQKRNSIEFHKLNKSLQKQAREEGYKNIGWNNVCDSWIILQKLKENNVIHISSYKEIKGSLTAVDALDSAILQTEMLITKGEELSKILLSQLR